MGEGVGPTGGGAGAGVAWVRATAATWRPGRVAWRLAARCRAAADTALPWAFRGAAFAAAPVVLEPGVAVCFSTCPVVSMAAWFGSSTAAPLIAPSSATAHAAREKERLARN